MVDRGREGIISKHFSYVFVEASVSSSVMAFHISSVYNLSYYSGSFIAIERQPLLSSLFNLDQINITITSEYTEKTFELEVDNKIADWDIVDITTMTRTFLKSDDSKNKHDIQILVKGRNLNINTTSLVFYEVKPDLHVLKDALSQVELKQVQKRVRRDNGRCGCKLNSWNVNFSSLEWHHWIVSPASVEANYCSGSCKQLMQNHRGHLNATDHAYLRYSYRSHGHSDVPAPTCVPTNFNSINIIKKGKSQNAYEVKTLDRIIAKTCSCV